MTQREREILNWIALDPLISQQELADKRASPVPPWQCTSPT